MTHDLFTLSILVEEQPLEEYPGDDCSWIAAVREAEFSLLLGNGTAARIGAVPSIDGVSPMDGQPAGYRSPCYLLEPRQRIAVPGWRLDDDWVARFQFGVAAAGYARRMGHARRNVGVIAAAFFYEKPREPQTLDSIAADVKFSVGPHQESAPPAQYEAARAPAAMEERPEDEECTDNLAVKFGAKQEHVVRKVQFIRRSEPAAVLKIRYDTQRALRTRGIGCPVPPGWTG